MLDVCLCLRAYLVRKSDQNRICTPNARNDKKPEAFRPTMSAMGKVPSTQAKRRTRFSRMSNDSSAKGRGDRKSKEGATSSSKKPGPPPAPTLHRRQSRISKESQKKLAEMQVAYKWAPPRKLTDAELQRAREMFYSLDSDGSGAIDVEELETAMRQLGQQPTEQELKELIFAYDEGDCDGQLQFREFCNLFAMSIDTKGEAKLSDATDCFASFGGDARDAESRVEAEKVREMLLRDFDLDVHVEDVFGINSENLTKQDMERIVLKSRQGGRTGGAPRVSYA